MADKVLVIDDDPNVAELIRLILKPRGLLTYHAADGQEGIKQAYELQPDLIILDIMMPEHDGYEICSRLREFSDVPILMLTAKSQSSDVTHGFAVGADDYVKKPFSNDELVSRIERHLRRNRSKDSTKKITGYSDGTLEIELASQKVTLDGEEIALTPTEFKLLAFLIRHPQKTLSARTLLTEVWGDAYSHDKALLSLYIHQLRQKLKESETEHKYIQTQWGQGYWFNPQSETKVFSQPRPIENEDAEKKEPNQNLKIWLLVALLVLLIQLVLILLQKRDLFSNLTERDSGGTKIGAIMTSEAFNDGDNTGVRGQVCISNEGENPTENLSIVSTVQAIGKQQSTFTSTTIDLDDAPNLDPNTAHCYPYEVFFKPVLEKDVEYYNHIAVTITNFTGLEIGSEHCPGPEPCPFGKKITTKFSLEKP